MICWYVIKLLVRLYCFEVENRFNFDMENGILYIYIVKVCYVF